MPQKSNSLISEIQVLEDCINESVKNYDFQWDTFFEKWFRRNGTPLFFLFKKNLSVTNTQFAELFSLLTLHNNSISGPSQLFFHSTSHVKEVTIDAINVLLEDYNPNDKRRVRVFAEKYIQVFRQTCAVDMFHSSCSVFLPTGINVDLEKIVFESGYIHSAGISIHIRNLKKARKNDFLDSLDRFVKSIVEDEIPFLIYSHEDFSGFDKASSELLKRGIEQCKLYVDKMSMGRSKLSSIINEIQNDSRFKKKLRIPKAGNYRKNHSFRSNTSVWMITDRGISGGNIGNVGQARYYICYQQLFKDDCPYFYFDENKPAWKSHTTMPHSLTSALLNIARPILNGGDICDPFGGSGTTWIETKRIGLSNKVRCSDLSESCNLLVEDNIEFFSLKQEEIEKLKKILEHYKNPSNQSIQAIIAFDNFDASNHFLKAKRYVEKLSKEDPNAQEFDLSAELISILKKESFVTRILFYLCLKATLRYQSAYQRKSIDFEKAFINSTDELLNQINLFLDFKKENESTTKSLNSSFIKVNSKYSFKVLPTLPFKKSQMLNVKIKKEVKSGLDARDFGDKKYDLIICDPPYGFNTDELEIELANLYDEFLSNAINALNKMGQLIICLPDESFTGRDLPYCTRRNLVSRQIILKSHEANRQIINIQKSLPNNELLPPFYWESEKALKRSILHFCFL